MSFSIPACRPRTSSTRSIYLTLPTIRARFCLLHKCCVTLGRRFSCESPPSAERRTPPLALDLLARPRELLEKLAASGASAHPLVLRQFQQKKNLQGAHLLHPPPPNSPSGTTRRSLPPYGPNVKSLTIAGNALARLVGKRDWVAKRTNEGVAWTKAREREKRGKRVRGDC